ncbi:lytic transglycosylase domain-containing protein [Candidatus Woesearchaeota archaeon]|jgi:hypothetical protein|nr:lytic transglycosylase domain-containing protein [Candidatus Woesearchaeota archaeon]MBT5740209.1 lytic transglycosylase domain-containing protein [Candidatus Woesearchaeota archaeon]
MSKKPVNERNYTPHIVATALASILAWSVGDDIEEVSATAVTPRVEQYYSAPFQESTLEYEVREPIPIKFMDVPIEEGYNFDRIPIRERYQLFLEEDGCNIERKIARTEQHADLISSAAERYEVPYETLFSLVVVESGGDPNAVSYAGAEGLTQIMPRTRKWLGCGDVTDPAIGLDCGASYLRQLLNQFGDEDLALAAFNIGPGRLERRLEAAGTDDFWLVFPESEYVSEIRAVELFRKNSID